MKFLTYLTILSICILPFAITGGISETDAKRALRSQGFTDVKITGYQFFDCSQDDFYHTGFTAKNIRGDSIEGTVCSGIFFKNSTIRF